MPQESTGTNEPHLALWHDHSTILHTGYILFAVWILYDPKIFLTEEYASLSGQQISNLQEIIKEPVIYDCSQFVIARIADSTSSRSSRMPTELSRPVLSNSGVEVYDRVGFFCGDTPARQFERGTQLGGTHTTAGVRQI